MAQSTTVPHVTLGDGMWILQQQCVCVCVWASVCHLSLRVHKHTYSATLPVSHYLCYTQDCCSLHTISQRVFLPIITTGDGLSEFSDTRNPRKLELKNGWKIFEKFEQIPIGPIWEKFPSLNWKCLNIGIYSNFLNNFWLKVRTVFQKTEKLTIFRDISKWKSRKFAEFLRWNQWKIQFAWTLKKKKKTW